MKATAKRGGAISSSARVDVLMLRPFLQSLLISTLFHSMLNVAYTFLVVVAFQSWLPTWRLDRRFPFSMIPLWVFCLISLAAWVVSVYYVIVIPKNHPKLGYDRVNVFFLYMVFGLFAWVLTAVSLIHTYYVGDFYVVSILRNIYSGKGPSPLELSREDVDVFPTLGDTVFIAYLLSFLLLCLASWRSIRAQHSFRRVPVGHQKRSPQDNNRARGPFQGLVNLNDD